LAGFLFMSKYYLLLDDVRSLEDVKAYTQFPSYLDNVAWTIVKSYNEFIEIILKLGLPEYITFDMDLADEHYDKRTWLKENPNYKEKDGIECVKFLINFCLDKKLKFPKCQIHSMNPVKKERAANLIENFIKFNDCEGRMPQS
jgi:hypothetical protein